MAKTSINVRACNIGSAERHNLRSKELDYIRLTLSYSTYLFYVHDACPYFSNYACAFSYSFLIYVLVKMINNHEEFRTVINDKGKVGGYFITVLYSFS